MQKNDAKAKPKWSLEQSRQNFELQKMLQEVEMKKN
jgi:hypothetical protein